MDGPNVPWSIAEWILTFLAGLLTTAYGAIIVYIFRELGRLNDRIDSGETTSGHLAESGKATFTRAIEEIREKLYNFPTREEFLRIWAAIEEERKVLATDRANIAVMMATKSELERQLDRQLAKFFEALETKFYHIISAERVQERRNQSGSGSGSGS